MTYPAEGSTPVVIQHQAPELGEYHKWVQDLKGTLDILEHDLRGDVEVQSVIKDSSGNQFIKPGWKTSESQRWLGEQGIRYVMAELRALVNKNTFFSNLEDARIYELCLAKINAITDNLFLNARKYKLEPENFDALVARILSFIELALRRAMWGKERTEILKSEQTRRIVQEEIHRGASGESWIDKIFRRGSKG